LPVAISELSLLPISNLLELLCAFLDLLATPKALAGRFRVLLALRRGFACRLVIFCA